MGQQNGVQDADGLGDGQDHLPDGADGDVDVVRGDRGRDAVFTRSRAYFVFQLVEFHSFINSH